MGGGGRREMGVIVCLKAMSLRQLVGLCFGKQREEGRAN